MSQSDQSHPVGRHCVRTENRREAVRKLIKKYPVVGELYDEGPNKDGKGGWVNAIKDQRESAYRLLFYLDRLPLVAEHCDKEPYEVLFGAVSDTDQPNYPRVLFTTTGGVNLIPDLIPEHSFVLAVQTNSLEIVPVTFDRDLLTSVLVKSGYAYICLYDVDADALRILDLNQYSEIYMVAQRREVQVRTDEEMVIGDATFVRPFFLKYRVKTTASEAADATDAATQALDDQ